MIEVRNIPYSRTANNIIQHLFGVVLADDKKYNLKSPIVEGFSNIKNIENRIEKKDNVIETGNSQQFTDYEKLLTHDGGIIINGYMQRFDYFKNHIDKLKNFIIPDESSDIVPGENDLVMHVRLTDYVRNGNNVPFVVYNNFIMNSCKKYDNIILVTDDPNTNFIKNLLQHDKVKLVHQSMIKDFDLLRISKNTFISQSSYSWLATYFGESKKIFVPLYNGDNRYLWKTNPLISDINLIDKKDERFEIITF